MKQYHIHIKQIVEQDYSIEANSAKEAKEIAESRYMDYDLDPIRDDGDISHTIKVVKA